LSERVSQKVAIDTVTSIIGSSELKSRGTLYNASVIFQSGRVVGLSRKNSSCDPPDGFAVDSLAIMKYRFAHDPQCSQAP